ncbi:DUF2726 domain-containing protein [Pseudomonas juntendi]|uniref:DUF2726 domain-containing protein n=1 Tax=Pseudomonas juntendi TaxID=2666183 RepID=A0ABD4YMI0_9PSED|nr:DUF2726 domain-containing protein [Pseudomonas juntendi]MDH0760379.1 DUF2726 domain-containing protein [Pseudomonas juntendi]MDH1917834.1 DUF2726 domain-containing protein [Pseudomonas juntendi]
MSLVDASRMNGPILLICTFAFAFLAVAVLKRRKGYSTKHYQCIPLLTEREQDFFWRLREAVGNDLVIAPQVVFGAFIKVKATAMTDKNHARHVVAHNRCDFLLCDKKLKPVALVEVDDSTHNSAKAKAKDRRRDELMKAVGVSVHRYRGMPTAKEIRKDLKL